MLIVSVNSIPEEKISLFEKFIHSLNNEKKEQYQDMLYRFNVKDANIFFDGKRTVVIHHIEENSEFNPADFRVSKHPFDVWFREKLKECHEETWEDKNRSFLKLKVSVIAKEKK